LKRHGAEHYDNLPEELRARYEVSQGALFGSVPSEKRSLLRQEVAEQMYFLITRFSGVTGIESRTTYKNLVTVFNQQCDLIEPKKAVENPLGDKEGDDQAHNSESTPILPLETGDNKEDPDGKIQNADDPSNTKSSSDSSSDLSKTKEKEVCVVPKKKTGGRVIQNPSDPDATYDGRKGPGYQTQFAETCSDNNEVQIITYCCPETACESDCNSVAPAMDKLEGDQLLPDEMLGDTLYGSDANVVNCEKHGVKLISPVSGKPPKEPPEEPTSKQKRLAARRKEEQTDEFRAAYAVRAGLEGTNSGIKRKTGLGRLRGRGRKSVFNAIFLKTAGWNILRASSSKKMKVKIARIVEESTGNKDSSMSSSIIRLLARFQRAVAMPIRAVVRLKTTILRKQLAA